MKLTKNKWFLPAFCVVLGGAVFAAQWIGGDPHGGLMSLALMSGFGILILASGRSETVRGLRGDARDERFQAIDIRASAFAGTAVVVTLAVVWLVELARGHDGDPYSELLAVAGVSYLAAIAFMRWRS